jgi:hypothetical protein
MLLGIYLAKWLSIQFLQTQIKWMMLSTLSLTLLEEIYWKG